MDLFGLGRVLDQLEQAVAINDRALGCSQVLTDAKRILVGQGHHDFTVVLFDIAHEVLKPVDKALPVSFNSALQRIWVCGKEVRGREHIHDLAREVLQLLAVAI